MGVLASAVVGLVGLGLLVGFVIRRQWIASAATMLLTPVLALMIA